MSERVIDPSLVIPNALLLAIVTFGLLAQDQSLQSIRPSPSVPPKNIATINRVRARLWEDPLAVRDREQTTQGSAVSSGSEESQITERTLKEARKNYSEAKRDPERQKAVIEDCTESILTLTRAREVAPTSSDTESPPSDADAAKELDSSRTLVRAAVKQALPSKDGESVKTTFFAALAKSEDGIDLARRIDYSPELLVVCLVRGGEESEDVESRIRVRQAVMAGMARSQYLPDQANTMVKLEIDLGTSHTEKASGRASFVREDFVPVNLAPPIDRFALTNLPISGPYTENVRDRLEDMKRIYSRIRVVYVDFAEMERAAPPGEDDSREENLSSLWSKVVAGIRDDAKGDPEIDVIGPTSSEELMTFLLLQSPDSGRGEPIDVFSPWASIEMDLLLQKIRGRVSNFEYDKLGAEPPNPSSTDRAAPAITDGRPWLMILRDKSLEECDKELALRFANYTLLQARDGIVALLHDLRTPSAARASSGTAQRTRIESMTVTDDQLAATLIDELANRRIQFSDSHSTIVLISESDSLYGRAFPITFRKKVLQLIGGLSDGSNPEAPNAGKGSIDIQSYSYLRGLDGRTILTKGEPPSKKEVRQEPDKKQPDPWQALLGSEAAKGKEKEPDWRPEGTQQYDRVRAVAHALKARDSGALSGGGRVVAVGVVGSDTYDKLVILQALRPALPQAIFFTTDLDANLATEENFPITRNVIVASPFGLRLPDRFQGATMPFRDSYQTAYFHSILRSTGFYKTFSAWERRLAAQTQQKRSQGMPAGCGNAECESAVKVSPAIAWPPNLYEIGHKGPVILQKIGSSARLAVTDGCQPNINGLNSIAPNLQVPETINLAVFVFCFLVISVGLLLLLGTALDESGLSRTSTGLESLAVLTIGIAGIVMAQKLRQTNVGEQAMISGFAICVVMIVTFAVIRFGCQGVGRLPLIAASLTGLYFLADIIYWASSAPGEEPFGVLDGVSAWPSEILRYIGLILGAYYTILATHDASRARQRLIKFLAARPKPNERIVAELQQLVSHESVKSKIRERLSDAPWWLYGVTVLLVFGGASCFMIFGLPQKPIRGDTALWVDKANLLGTIVIMYLLTGFAVLRNCFCLFNVIAPCEKAIKRGEISNGELGRFVLRAIEMYSIGLRRLPLFPCLILFVLILSRHPALDNWTIPVSLVCVVLYAVGILAIVSSIIGFRARRLKGRIQYACEAEAVGNLPPLSTPIDEQAALLSVKEGAFGTLLSDPVLRAVLVPIGGGGFLALVELFR